MKRVLRRLLLGSLVAGSVVLPFVPIARADATLIPTTEAWYQANPTCGAPTGCLSPDALPVTPPVAPPQIPAPLSPYPSGTLHVGWTGGAESARAYLAFPFEGLTGTLTGAQLDVPLDTAPADGDAQSASEKAIVCLVTGPITKVEAGITTPPSVSCDQHADLTYVATPAPHLHADLAPLLLGLPTTSGIALLPDATKNAQTDAWRFVFSAHDRADAAKTPPASLSLAITEDDVVSTPEQPVVALPDGTGAGSAPPPPTTGLESTPSLPTDTVGTPPQVSQPQTQPTAQTQTFGYAYPVVWLLPLALLVLVPVATRALTKDLSPV